MIEPLHVEDVEDGRDCPELRLWRAVLAYLVADAISYWQGTDLRSNNSRKHDGGLSAFEQITQCGSELQFIWDNTGHEQEVIRSLFLRWLAQNPKKIRRSA